MNRRGAAGYSLWIGWFLFILVIGISGIALGNGIFYGKGYDGRLGIAAALHAQVRECIMTQTIDWGNESRFFEQCRLDGATLRGTRQGVQKPYLLRVCLERCDTGSVSIRVGSDFVACDFTHQNEADPRCTRGFVSSIDSRTYEVITGATKTPRMQNG